MKLARQKMDFWGYYISVSRASKNGISNSVNELGGESGDHGRGDAKEVSHFKNSQIEENNTAYNSTAALPFLLGNNGKYSMGYMIVEFLKSCWMGLPYWLVILAFDKLVIFLLF